MATEVLEISAIELDGIRADVRELEIRLSRVGEYRRHELTYVIGVLRNITKQSGEAARESANDTIAWAENRLRDRMVAAALAPLTRRW